MAKPRGIPFKKGNSGNPAGRPKAPEIEQLRLAIEQVQKKKGKDLLTHFVEMAYEDTKVLVALGKKIVPDLSASDLNLKGELTVLPPIVRGNLDKGKETKVIESKEKDVKNGNM